jgi:hypothetical protein
MSCAINTECGFARGTTIAVCPALVIHTSEILNTGQKNFVLVPDKRQERLRKIRRAALMMSQYQWVLMDARQKSSFWAAPHGRGCSRHRQPCFPHRA